jgi:hypothetical protein
MIFSLLLANNYNQVKKTAVQVKTALDQTNKSFNQMATVNQGTGGGEISPELNNALIIITIVIFIVELILIFFAFTRALKCPTKGTGKLLSLACSIFSPIVYLILYTIFGC